MEKKKGKPIKTKEKIKIYHKKRKNDPESVTVKKLQDQYEKIDLSTINTFSDLPLSAKTLKGLKECDYTKPTDIQRETIQLALRGKDILGAAQTGSGKTLAFIIPILEVLFCKQWSNMDGVGAVVITPTRELAYQIFETLRRVGEHHNFSAGLIIGGKDLKFERNRMDQCNIVICTPGRLLQHMDENPLFDCVNMQILVLDEADRCLDMGFAPTMNAIIANLPAERQTLLFSATQTRSVQDLARLSLTGGATGPSYVAVHEHKAHSTPEGLRQNYTVCALENKLAVLWSFLKNHQKCKSIVFLASCKQVKYWYEIFCKLRPGVSVLALYGTLHQLRRMEVYEGFCRKSSAVLFATDIAARGLDFPEVHWVVQADCPEDADTYIHRVGRTARYSRGGDSLLLLLPSEIAMVDDLIEKKIPVEKTDINPEKLMNPVRKIEAFLAKDPTLKDSAQRAFKSYAKAVFLMKNKKVFQVNELDTDAYAKSLGLAIPPRIRFLQKMNKNQVNNNKIYFNTDDNTADSNSEENNEKSEIHKGESTPFHVSDDDSDCDNDILKVKRKNHEIELPNQEELDVLQVRKLGKKPITKAALVKKLMNKNIVPNKKTVFTDDGDIVAQATKEKRSQMAIDYENEDYIGGGIDLVKAREILQEEDKFDKVLFREKVKAKKKEAKQKLKQQKKEEREEKIDEFGESESEGEGPDLGWMPDPDELYGKRKEGEEEKEFYVKSDEESEKKRSKLKKKVNNDENSDCYDGNSDFSNEDSNYNNNDEISNKVTKKSKKASKSNNVDLQEDIYGNVVNTDDSDSDLDTRSKKLLETKNKSKKTTKKSKKVISNKKSNNLETSNNSDKDSTTELNNSDKLTKLSKKPSNKNNSTTDLDTSSKKSNKKRKLESSVKATNKLRKLNEATSNLNVNEAEELALMLLNKS